MQLTNLHNIRTCPLELCKLIYNKMYSGHLKKIKGKGFSMSKFIIDSSPKTSLFPKTNNKAHKINE